MQLIEDASKEKLRGGYYTPEAIARFILQWGMSGCGGADMLEPSCGDGAFLRCVADGGLSYRSVTAVELDEGEACKARLVNLPRAEVFNMDFHRFCLDTDRRFDIIVGNPPFIRYQYYDEGQQQLADEIFRRVGLKRSKLTNAWVTFVLGCTQLLKAGGKMGMVIPSELLQVKYAAQLRKHLACMFGKISIISFENLVFEEIQQEVILLLCENMGADEHLIEHLEVRDADGLRSLDADRVKLPMKKLDFHTDKWNCYFLDKRELEFIQAVSSSAAPRIKSYADVEVGITTGANNYFTVTQQTVRMYQLEQYARPMVGRSVQVSGISFTHDDWALNSITGSRANLLVFTPDAKTSGGEGVRAYLENGEAVGINKGYKTGIRDDWYVVPSIKLSSALFLRRNNMYPKFVLNEAGAYTTDTMHRIFIHEGVNSRALVASYYNSLSFAFAEILGRNFGGGCLELMPSEVGEIFMPYNESNEAMFDTIDSMLRQKKSTDEILDYTDNIILCQGMGFTREEAALSRSIWHKLMGRRLKREPAEKASTAKTPVNGKPRIKQLDFLDTLLDYPGNIVENHGILAARESSDVEYGFDPSRNVLVALVSDDCLQQFLDKSAKFYYTGKRFPSSIALHKLYYFMPYIKHRGIRDLYIIKTARVGTKRELLPESDDDDYRLVLEIEFVGQVFIDHKSFRLDIWRTFADRKLGKLWQELK